MSSIFHPCIKPAFPLLTNHDASLFLSVFSFSVHFLSSEAYIPSLFILSNFFCHTPLFSSFHSLSLSSSLSVTLPPFSARCDQLGDISPTDFPGDRTSGGHGLLHLSSFCLPSVSPLHTWLSCHSCSSLPSAPLLFSAVQTTDLAPRPFPPLQYRTLIPHGADSDTSASALLSSVSPVIYPPFPLPFMFWLHADSDASPFFPSALSAPTLFHPFLFSSPFAFLYLALSRLPFTMTDLSSLLYANRSPVS